MSVFKGGVRAIRACNLSAGVWVGIFLASGAFAQKTLTWEDAKRELRATNPTLVAQQIEVQQSRTNEITAYLRPNPDLTVSVDQLTFLPSESVFRPFTDALPFVGGSYLIERRHKRDLRRQSARAGTSISVSELADEERNLLFDLRGAFILVLQNKAVLALARDSLGYYDRVLDVSRDRLRAGDIAEIDFKRLELQRLQFETDVESARVNLQTAKIQLRALLNDRTALDQLEVTGRFDFTETIPALDGLRQTATENRPDLRAAQQAVQKAEVDHRLAIANGSTDPTIGWNVARDPPIRAFVGFSVTIPIRMFDRNQGEKERTRLDIERQRRLVEGTRIQVLSDVESAFESVQSSLRLLRPYRVHYLEEAAEVRETIWFSYQSGEASLLEFLQAQQDYRQVYLSYLNLVGSYLTAVNQLNLAVGLEVVP